MNKSHSKGNALPFDAKVPEKIHRVQEQFRNKERSQYRKDKRNGKVLYSSLDTPEMTGEEMMPDREAVSVEETVERLMLCEQVRKAVDSLPATQKELINALFFEGKTEQAVAGELGISQQAVSKRVQWALIKLKKILKK